jgi:type II secretory pathway predicted ATPase ExeA
MEMSRDAAATGALGEAGAGAPAPDAGPDAAPDAVVPLPLYAEAFGFLARPFSLGPDAGTIFWSQAHKRAQSVLEYGLVSSAPVVLLSGEIGTGKTTLVQDLIGRLGAGVRVALLANGRGGRPPIAAWVLSALGIAPAAGADEVALTQQLQAAVIAEYAAGRRVVVIVDEAQSLGAGALEELRLLTNVNSGRDELVQLVLVGQPELRARLRAPGLRQLAQRVVAATHLGPMDAETVLAYVAHRLRAAGGTGDELTPAAARAVHAATGGIARLINQLCDFALLYAWSLERQVVDEALVALVLSEGVFFGGGGGAPAAPVAASVVAAEAARVQPLREAFG